MTAIELTRCAINRYAAKKLTDKLFQIEFNEGSSSDSDWKFKNFFEKYEDLINEISLYMKYDILEEISEKSTCEDLIIHKGFCREFVKEIEEHLNSKSVSLDSKILGIILLISKAYMNNISDENHHENITLNNFFSYFNLHI